MEYETLRYEHVKGALAQCCTDDLSLCDLFMDILQTGELAARCEAQFLARFGLNSARLIILVLLNNADSGSMRSSELARCSRVSRATMTGLLDTLEKADLISRAEDPRDRRAVSVKIAAKGEALLDAVQPEMSLWTEKMLAPLTRSEREELSRLLRKAQAILDAPAVDEVCGR
jgi:DNA-binding MarR family transcriptional regulator